MRKVILLLFAVMLLTIPVSAVDVTAPTAPESVAEILPADPESFGQGLWDLLRAVIPKVEPELAEGAGICLALIAAALLVRLFQPINERGRRTGDLVSTLAVGALLLRPAGSMIRLAVNTVGELNEYGKQFLPVMTAALAAQGGVTKSAALYTGTTVFSTVLNSVISALLIPLVYIFLVLAVGNSAVGEELLKKLRDLVKWLAGWILKTALSLFTGYISLTGVISGSTDAAALKATKLAISTAVPVVGGALAEASETVLISAGLVKSAAGIYGMLALIAIFLEPFLVIGLQYLLLKLTAAVCSVFATPQTSGLIGDFSTALGLLLAVTGSMCLIFLVGSVCFMMGVG